MWGIINNFFSFVILFNYVIPISLYVTVEAVKFISSYFIKWDIEMYHEVSYGGMGFLWELKSVKNWNIWRIFKRKPEMTHHNPLSLSAFRQPC